MRSRSLVLQLAVKDWRELVTSRAALVLFVVIGPLVGHAFITAVETYAEASGSPGGGPAALAQGLSPLDGLVVPTFGAYALAIALLYPFVAIRLVSSEKQSGAFKLLLQTRASVGAMVAVKLAVLLVAWVAAWLPGLAALGLWRAYGGHLNGPEVASVLLGHAVRALLTCAVALLAAAMTDGAATAAVVTLAFTLGTWALDFIAQVHGGVAQTLAAYTPDAALRVFESGEIRAGTMAVSVTLGMGALALAGIALAPGRRHGWRVAWTLAAVMATAGVVWPAARLRASWDVSEDRRNSFPPADERALHTLREPLRITVHLAPEDPRLADLERGVLRKLRRAVPQLAITYASRSASGLFEGSGAHYGEVWYELGAKRTMSRSTTPAIVLEEIYGLAGRSPPTPDTDRTYPGYPLTAEPAFAAPLFYVLWPVLVIGGWWWVRRPRLRYRTAENAG